VTPACIPPSRPVALRILALLAYPILIVIALWMQQPELRALALPLLAVALVGPWPTEIAGRVVLLGSLLLAAAVFALPALALWPPGLICLVVAAWFAQSLQVDRRPVIERFAAVIVEDQGGEIPTDSLAWMRGWTLAWAILLAILGVIALALAIANLTSLWLAWVMGAMPFLVFFTLWLEYTLRKSRFPDQEHIALGKFLLLIYNTPPERVAR